MTTRTRWTRWLLPLFGCSLLLASAAAAKRPAELPGATGEPPMEAGFAVVGGYLITGDWRLELVGTIGTDPSNDTVNQKERARVLAYSEEDSRRRGEQHDCLVVEQVRDLRAGRAPALGPGFAIAQQVRRQLTPPLLSL